MSFVVQLNCELKEGVKESFCENLKGELGSIVARGFPGNRGVFVAWSTKDPNKCIIQQRWLTPKHSQAYVKMRAEGNNAEWREKYFKNLVIESYTLEEEL